MIRPLPVLAFCLALAACGQGASEADEDGIRQVNGATLVEDEDGATLVIDANGCQAVIPAAGGPAEPVRDADGAPACLPPGGR